MVTHRAISESGPGTPTLGLHFANSASGPTPHDDPLRSNADFTNWWHAAWAEGERTPASLPALLPDQRTLLLEARRLRTAVRSVLSAVAQGSVVKSDALLVINRAINFAPRIDHLVRSTAAGRLRMERPLDGDHPLAALSTIALDAAELITAVDPRRLRVCASGDCGTWFVDTSKGGRRRWCSMSLCGNRSKAARYRIRQAGE